ncbi:TPA: hypothetical protein OT922_003778 [Morganella morganii]|nr:hypothetical protein [Morganella morganii]
MDSKILELAKKLKLDAVSSRGHQVPKCTVWSDQLISLCSSVEKMYQDRKDSAGLINAFIKDDIDWNLLLDSKNTDISILTDIIIKLADKCILLDDRFNNIVKNNIAGHILITKTFGEAMFFENELSAKSFLNDIGFTDKKAVIKKVYFID